MTMNVFLSPLKYILQLYFAKFLVLATFWGDGTVTGRDTQTHTHVDRQTFLGKYYFRFEHKNTSDGMHGHYNLHFLMQ